MGFNEVDLAKQEYIFSAIFTLANHFQVFGNKVDPAVSLKQWFVLATISKFTDAPPNLGDIAKMLRTSRQNIKKITVILESKGYVQLKKDTNDLRNIQLFLTEKCFDYFKSRERQENKYMEQIFSNIDNKILSSLCDGLEKLIENIDVIMEGDENAERR